MTTRENETLTLSIPGGLAGQVFAVGYAGWISSNLGYGVHLQFHDLGTDISKFSVAELCDTKNAKKLNISYSLVSRDWPPSYKLSKIRNLRRILSGYLKRSRRGSIFLRVLSVIRQELKPHSKSSNFGVISKSTLKSAKKGNFIVGYPTDYQIIEESWFLLSKMFHECGALDFTIDTATEESIALHWRLGDYVENSFHGAVSWSSLFHCLEGIGHSDLPLKIFTDSPDLAIKTIGNKLNGRNYSVISGEIWSDLKYMTKSRIFIGTNSGISFLVALALSQDSNRAQIWLPKKWFLNSEPERHFNVPEKTFSSAFFYPVGLSTEPIPK